MTITCEYCNKVLSNVGNLTRHQKSKTCLKTRKDVELYIVEDRFKCEYCFKYMTTKGWLNKHKVLCVKRYKRLLEEKDSEIEYLKQSKDSEIESLKEEMIELKTKCQMRC